MKRKEGTNEWRNKWTKGQMNEGINKRRDKWTNERRKILHLYLRSVALSFADGEISVKSAQCARRTEIKKASI